MGLTKRERVLWLVVAFAALLVGITCWQMARLSRALRTMPADDAGEILIGALSAEVLAPGVDGSQPSVQGTEPLLDQYRKNPELTRRRYLLVMTWLHASQMFKTIDPSPRFEGKMISSSTLLEIPQDERVDGWGRPYCILADTDRITFLSGGGKAALNCESLRQTAMQAAAQSTDSRLTKDGELLVAVYRRGEVVPTTQP